MHVHCLCYAVAVKLTRHVGRGVDVDVGHYVETKTSLDIFCKRHSHVEAYTLGTNAYAHTHAVGDAKKLALLVLCRYGHNTCRQH